MSRQAHNPRECWCGLNHELERRIAGCTCGAGNANPFHHKHACPIYDCGRVGCGHSLDTAGVPICGIGRAG